MRRKEEQQTGNKTDFDHKSEGRTPWEQNNKIIEEIQGMCRGRAFSFSEGSSVNFTQRHLQHPVPLYTQNLHTDIIRTVVVVPAICSEFGVKTIKHGMTAGQLHNAVVVPACAVC